MPTTAQFIGLLVLVQGLVGLLRPDGFVALVATLQVPPLIYLAAVVRVVIGVVLLLAASRSRSPMLMRGLGGLIVVGGALTPFLGVQFAQVVLRWWSEGGDGMVRAWATFALALGAIIVYANCSRREVI